MQRKNGLWSEAGRAKLEALQLAPWSSRRRADLLRLIDEMQPKIDELTAATQHEAQQRPEVQRLMTHPGVGAITALAFVLILGKPEAIWLWQASGKLLGTDPSRRIQWRSPALRTYQQTRQHSVALLASRGRPRSRAIRFRLETSFRAPGHASWTHGGKGCDGPQTGSPFVLDVAQGMGLSAELEVRFARGVARQSTWCAVKHR